MREEQFIKANSDIWRELESLSDQINKTGIKSLSTNQVKRFLHVFKVSSHNLAYARTHYSNNSITEYLNSLVGRCHSNIYAVKKSSLKEFIKYITYGFPNLLKEYKWFIFASFGFFALGFFISLFMVIANSDNANYFLQSSLVQGVKNGSNNGASDWNSPLMSSYIMTNNIVVSLKAFVYGITLGLGTIYVLFFNGTTLGALTALEYMYGSPVKYWSLILPHGIIELTAIFISGAAGLIIAKSMLIPNEYSRKSSLIDGAKKAVSLVLGIVLMLVIAGTIEGFFTPMKIRETSKLYFALITAAALALYFSIPYFKGLKKKS